MTPRVCWEFPFGASADCSTSTGFPNRLEWQVDDCSDLGRFVGLLNSWAFPLLGTPLSVQTRAMGTRNLSRHRVRFGLCDDRNKRQSESDRRHRKKKSANERDAQYHSCRISVHQTLPPYMQYIEMRHGPTEYLRAERIANGSSERLPYEYRAWSDRGETWQSQVVPAMYQ